MDAFSSPTLSTSNLMYLTFGSIYPMLDAMGNEPLSIDTLEQGLRTAELELVNATAARQRATEIEAEWQTEVTSLKSLIQIRKQRMNMNTLKESRVQDINVPREDYPTGGTLSSNGAQNENVSEDGLNRVDWIDGLISASGTMGIAPPEIMKAAERESIKMHPNYPYVVLRKLVDKDRAVKRRGRYYKKGI